MARKAFSHRCTDVVCIDEEHVMFTKLFKLVFYFEKFQFYNLVTHIFLSIKWSRKFVSMKFLSPATLLTNLGKTGRVLSPFQFSNILLCPVQSLFKHTEIYSTG